MSVRDPTQVSVLLRHTVDVNALGPNGTMPLHDAAENQVRCCTHVGVGASCVSVGMAIATCERPFVVVS